MPLNLLAEVDRWGEMAPERVAHRSGDRQVTYRELIAGANALAGYLAAILADDEAPVAVVGHKEPELLMGFLGCVKAGHPYVPLDSGLPGHRILATIEAARAPLTLSASQIAAIAADGGTPPLRTGSPGELHYVMFTSGSTGEPKGVPITRGNLSHFLKWMLGHRFEPAGEVFLNQAIWSFDLSVMDTYLSLVTGGTLVSLSQKEVEDPRALFWTLKASGVTTWVSTPTFAQMCLAERRFDRAMLPGVRRFIFCGETLAPETVVALLERFPEAEVWNTYGPTECTVATTSVRIDRESLRRHRVLPIGRPMRGTRVVVVDEELRPLPPGERGEILIAGPNVSPGYLYRPDLSRAAFVAWEGERAYRTGDGGHLEDGLLFFDGRMDNQLKLHGYRIELGDVEANLCALRGVRAAVVVPVMKNGRADSLTAFVLLAERPAVPEFELTQELKTRLQERIPRYMVPRRFRYLESFPMTPNGKMDRRKLAELCR